MTGLLSRRRRVPFPVVLLLGQLDDLPVGRPLRLHRGALPVSPRPHALSFSVPIGTPIDRGTRRDAQQRHSTAHG